MAVASGTELKRQIGLYAATAITVGNIIGSAIFRSPHSVAQELPGFMPVILAWIVGGVLSICGSPLLTELAVRHPRTGGLYVFIREGFGDAWAFTFGWANLWVIKPTVIASIVSVFALYFCQVTGWGHANEFAVGCAAIALLTFVNWLGVREGAGTQSVFTTAKLVGILGVCLAAYTLTSSHPVTPLEHPVLAGNAGHPLLLAMALSMMTILFGDDGWRRRRRYAPARQPANRDPRRHLARGRRVRAHELPLLPRARSKRGRELRGGRLRDRSPAARRRRCPCARGARRGVHVRHHERRDPHRPARDPGDGRGRPAVEAARRAASAARLALARAVDPGGPFVSVAQGGEPVRRRLGLVRDHVVALLRRHHRHDLHPARAREARRAGRDGVPHAALPAAGDRVPRRHRRHHLERFLEQRPHSAHGHPARHGRGAHRGDRLPGLLPVARGQACLRRA